MRRVKKLSVEFLQLTSKMGVSAKMVEREFQRSGANGGELGFEEEVGRLGDVPVVRLEDVGAFENENPYLILKRIKLKKASDKRRE